jgi:predicted porin
MKKIVFGAVLPAVVGLVSALCATNALAQNAPMATKAPIYAPAGFGPPLAGPATCGGVGDFFLTNCVLSWWGVTVYGTVDMGVTYQTHGDGALDINHPVGASYLLGNSATNAVGRVAGFGWGPNALSQSLVGVKTIEPLGAGWNFISVNELAFDPYSALLANAPQAMWDARGVPENQQLIPYDSSRWGWLAAQNFIGVSSANYGTLSFGRQNTPILDAVNAYDPMGGSYAFSVIGNSGATCGAGDTETCRWTTAIKYRVNVGDIRFVVAGQPIGGPQAGYNAYNPNQGAVEGGIGGDIKRWGPGILSVDVLGAYERDAVNWSTLFPGQTFFGTSGTPITFPSGPLGSGLKATISNNTSFMAVAKYSFGSWGNPAPPIVGKAAPPPSGPTGIPLTFYAGYEWIQFANPSDPQTTSFRDDGFQFFATNAAGSTFVGSPNSTTIANNAFNAACGSGVGGCYDRVLQSMWAGGKYGITRDLDFIGAYYHYIQSTFVNGVNCSWSVAAANSRCQGYFDAYSFVLDWRFLPKWDAYIGTMWSGAYGGLANGDISRNNLATTAGVRFRF